MREKKGNWRSHAYLSRPIVASANSSADGGWKSMNRLGSSTSTSITISTPSRTTPSTRA
jgi:hypothetical protein